MAVTESRPPDAPDISGRAPTTPQHNAGFLLALIAGILLLIAGVVWYGMTPDKNVTSTIDPELTTDPEPSDPPPLDPPPLDPPPLDPPPLDPPPLDPPPLDPPPLDPPPRFPVSRLNAMRAELEGCDDIWCVRRVKDRYCSSRWSHLPPECRRSGL